MTTKATTLRNRAGARRGLHTPSDLRAACTRSGQHWLWHGCMVRNRPVATISGDRVHGARIVARLLGREAERQPHERWTMQCGIPNCLSPQCLLLVGSQGEALRVQSAAGRLKRGADASLAISRSRKRAGLCYADELVQWALESGQSDTAVAHALGCCKTTVALWRGRRHTPNLQTAGIWGQLLVAGFSARKAVAC